jgi:hypothetical protein
MTFSIGAVARSKGSGARGLDVGDDALADRQREQFVHQQHPPNCMIRFTTGPTGGDPTC